MFKNGTKMIVKSCAQGTENFGWGFREGEAVTVLTPFDVEPGMIAVESTARGMVGVFALADLTLIGINGDAVPHGAISNCEKIAYAYVRVGNRRKCAGYATPEALKVIYFNEGGSEKVSIEYFEPGEQIPDLI